MTKGTASSSALRASAWAGGSTSAFGLGLPYGGLSEAAVRQ